MRKNCGDIQNTHKSRVFNKLRSLLLSKLIVNSLECKLLEWKLEIYTKLDQILFVTYICRNPPPDNLGIFPEMPFDDKSLNK